RPAQPSDVSIRCSARVACIINSSLPCGRIACGRSWKSSVNSSSNNQLLPIFMASSEMRGILRGGTILALISTTSIVNFVNAITLNELIEDPNDFIATHLLALARDFSVQTQHFYAFYLLIPTALKIDLCPLACGD